MWPPTRFWLDRSPFLLSWELSSMRKRTDKSFVTNKGGSFLHRQDGRMSFGSADQGIRAVRLARIAGTAVHKVPERSNKPRGHWNENLYCILRDPDSVHVRFEAGGHRTDRRIRPSSPKLGGSSRLGGSRPIAGCQIRNADQIGEPHRWQLREVEIRKANSRWRHNNQKRKIGASEDQRWTASLAYTN